MRVVDVMFAFPVLLLALAVVAILGPGVTTTILAIGIVYTPIFARVARASTLSVRVEPFVQVSRTMGTGHLYILARHILPNIAGPLIVQTSLSLAFAILSEAALSFLGLGIQPPQPSLGRMIFDSQGFVTMAWWMAVFPGAAIFVIVLAFNLLGDGLRDVLDPKQRTMIEARRQASDRPVLDRPRPAACGSADARSSAGVAFDVAARADAGHRRRIRFGQVDDGAGRDRACSTRLAPSSAGSSTLARRVGPTQLVGASPRVLRSVHGGRIGFVFQDPGTSLNPLLTLERQITESLETHRNMTRRQANARALELLEAVGLPEPQTRLHSYPHQLSGGQRQRVMIAIALACDPELLIADEPTTSLDVTTQAQIIDLVRDLQRDFGTAVVWISHDLGVIGQVADDVTVLRDGEVVEQAPILDVFDEPQNTYTRELLQRRPLIGRSGPPPRRRRRAGAAARRRARRALRGDHAGRQVDRPCGEGPFVRDSAGHDAGTGRRIGLGQVDGGGGADRTRRTGRGHRTVDGTDVFGVRRRRREGAAPPDRPRLPGSVLVAEPT